MATANPFDLLGDDDNDDVSALVKSPPVVKEKQGARKTSNAPVQTLPSGKLLAKPLPPAQAVREVRALQTEGGRGRGGSGRGGRGNRDQDFGRGRGGNINSEWGSDRESYDGYGGRGGFYESSISYAPGRQEDGEVASGERGRGGGGGRGGGRGGRGGRGHGGGRGFGGDAGEEEGVGKRMYDRRSGTGRGTEMKREGSGRGNWGTPVDREVLQEMEEPTSTEEEKLPTLENAEIETNQDIPPVNEEKKQEEEDKEMTLDEYERLLEEKRKKLLGGQKVEERKVDATAFESMKQLSIKKKDEDAVFIKVASEKDKEKKNDVGERDERIRKPISINEFLKPVEGERHYGVGRGRGRGRGNRGGGGFGGGDNALQSEAPSIEDHGQFPTLGGK